MNLECGFCENLRIGGILHLNRYLKDLCTAIVLLQGDTGPDSIGVGLIRQELLLPLVKLRLIAHKRPAVCNNRRSLGTISAFEVALVGNGLVGLLGDLNSLRGCGLLGVLLGNGLLSSRLLNLFLSSCGR